MHTRISKDQLARDWMPGLMCPQAPAWSAWSMAWNAVLKAFGAVKGRLCHQIRGDLLELFLPMVVTCTLQSATM